MSSERFERIHGTKDDLSHLSAKDGVKAGRGWVGGDGSEMEKDLPRSAPPLLPSQPLGHSS